MERNSGVPGWIHLYHNFKNIQDRPTVSFEDILLFTYAYTGIQKYFFFLKEISSAHQGCIYLIKNTAKTVILWNIITV